MKLSGMKKANNEKAAKHRNVVASMAYHPASAYHGVMWRQYHVAWRSGSEIA